VTILALDTTSARASLALRRDGVTLAQLTLDSPDGYAHLIFQAITRLTRNLARAAKRPTAETIILSRRPSPRTGGRGTMQRQVSSIRSVLAGFAGLLLLMGCLAVDSARQTRDVSTTSAALRKESRDRDTLLDQLLADIYRSATLTRDYMLEHDDVLAAGQKAELQQLRRQVEQTLVRYGDHAPEKERVVVQSLQQHAESYWTSLAPALDWGRTARRELPR